MTAITRAIAGVVDILAGDEAVMVWRTRNPPPPTPLSIFYPRCLAAVETQILWAHWQSFLFEIALLMSTFSPCSTDHAEVRQAQLHRRLGDPPLTQSSWGDTHARTILFRFVRHQSYPLGGHLRPCP
jgi:hypothetical protein